MIWLFWIVPAIASIASTVFYSNPKVFTAFVIWDLLTEDF